MAPNPIASLWFAGERGFPSTPVQVIQTKNLGSLFHFGVAGLHVHRGTALLRGFSYVAAAGHLPTLPSRSRHLAKTGSHLGFYAHWGCSGHSRVRWRGIGLSRTAARRGGKGGERSAQHSFGRWAASGIALVSRIVAGAVVLRSRRSVAIAPLCGSFECGGPHGQFRVETSLLRAAV